MQSPLHVFPLRQAVCCGGILAFSGIVRLWTKTEQKMHNIHSENTKYRNAYSGYNNTIRGYIFGDFYGGRREKRSVRTLFCSGCKAVGPPSK